MYDAHVYLNRIVDKQNKCMHGTENSDLRQLLHFIQQRIHFGVLLVL
jgi:hypothetical protein